MELPALPIQPIHLKIGPNWANRQCCLADSSKTARRILIFSIEMGADYSFYVKTNETYALTFLTLNISAIGRMFTVQMYIYCAIDVNLLPLLLCNVHMSDHYDIQF